MMPIIIVPAAATANVNMANAKVCIPYTILGIQASLHQWERNCKHNSANRSKVWHTRFLCRKAAYAL